MRIALFSDVHGNLTALEAVLADIKKQSPDLTIFAGDLCLFGAHPAECIARLQQEEFSFIRGNTDEALSNQPLLSRHIEAEKKERRQDIDNIVEWTWSQLNAEQRAWLQALPEQRRISPTPHPKDDLYVVHANPQDTTQPIYPTAEKQQAIYGEIKQPDDDPDLRHLLQDLICGILAFGHIHIPNIRYWQDIVLANISSVSLAQDGDQRAKYGLLTWRNNDGWQINHQYVTYDLDAELDLLAEKQPPGWESLAQRLQNALP